MNQPPLQNPNLQNDRVEKSRTVDGCPENNIQGNTNRAIQGNENLAVQGDANTVSQNSNNLNGFGSHFIKNIQADQISFINVTYSEAIGEKKINCSQVSVEKKEGINNKGKATFILTGTIDLIDENFLRLLEAHLRKKSNDAELTILKVEEGSIKITLEASQESLELLKNLFESGELTEVLDIPVEDVQVNKIDVKTLLLKSFQKIFENMNQEGIKESVDKKGIDKFIYECALLAATTGAASGFGRFSTMIVGLPADVLNNVLQQFRVTLAVIYYKKGVYKVSFPQFMKIVGVSLGVEIGTTLTKSIMLRIVDKIIIRLSAKTASKAAPFVGAFVGGSVNYSFIRGIGSAVKRIDMSNISFEQDGVVQGDNNQAVLGDNNQVTQQNQVGTDADATLTKEEVIKLLAELEALVKTAELPAETKEEVVEDLSSAQKATDKEEPNKNLALKRLGSVAETLEKTSKTVESGQKVWTSAKPIIVKVATWLGATAGSHLLGL